MLGVHRSQAALALVPSDAGPRSARGGAGTPQNHFHGHPACVTVDNRVIVIDMETVEPCVIVFPCTPSCRAFPLWVALALKRPTRHPCWALRILIPVRSGRPDAQHVAQGDSTHVGKAHHHENVEYLYTSLKQAPPRNEEPPSPVPAATLARAECARCSLQLYKKAFLPLEEHYSYSDFFSPVQMPSCFLDHLRCTRRAASIAHARSNRVWWLQAMSATDIEAKPFVLLIGQYSVGKTTFINHLLGDRPHGCDAPMLLLLLLASHRAWWLINLTLHRTVVERCATPCRAVDALLPADSRPDETVRPPQVPRLQRGARADD